MTYQQACFRLKQGVRVKNAFIMASNVGPNGFSCGESHFHSYFCPLPIPADYIKTSFIRYQLQEREKK